MRSCQAFSTSHTKKSSGQNKATLLLHSKSPRHFFLPLILALVATRSRISICCKNTYLSVTQPGVLPPVSYQAMR